MKAVKSLRVSVRLVGMLLTVVLLGSGLVACSGNDQAPEAVRPTPLAKLRADKITLPRIDFCTLVPEETIAAALGQEKLPKDVAKSDYTNGDEVDVADGVRARVQEIGCRWTSGSETVTAWLFARPADAAFAQSVIARTPAPSGCSATKGGFSTSYSLVCADRVRHAGLFGQTWFSCEVKGTPAAGEIGKRADQWCSALVSELDAD